MASVDYNLIEELGFGSFGKVFKAIHKQTGMIVALKITSKQDPMSLLSIRREYEVLRTIDHPYIASFFEYFENEDYCYLAIEYGGDINLLERLNEQEPLHKDLMKKIFMQLSLAIDYLHNEKHIVHRDIKLENIILDDNCNIKLIDFGFAKEKMQEDSLLTTLCGSQQYISPEIFLKTGYTEKADIWSAGIVLYALITGRLPFDNPSQNILTKLIMYSPPMFPYDMDKSAQELIMKMLSKTPKQRPNTEEILNHKYLQTYPMYDKLMQIKITGQFIMLPNNELSEKVKEQMIRLNIGYDNVIDELKAWRGTSYRILRNQEIMEALDKEIGWDEKFPRSKSHSNPKTTFNISNTPDPPRTRMNHLRIQLGLNSPSAKSDATFLPSLHRTDQKRISLKPRTIGNQSLTRIRRKSCLSTERLMTIKEHNM